MESRIIEGGGGGDSVDNVGSLNDVWQSVSDWSLFFLYKYCGHAKFFTQLGKNFVLFI
jgi:hypothetical protein